MGLGAGLGGFVDGLARGINFSNSILDRKADQEDRERRRAIEDERLGWEREDRAFQTEERTRQAAERDRAAADREDLDAISADASAQFEAGVAAGTYKPEDFDAFFQDYALPKMYAELIEQRDFAGAEALKNWGESTAAKQGGRLFGSAMFKANSGDFGGALDDAIKAGKVSGYIDHEFEFSEKEEIKDQAGNLIGYRVTMKDASGNELEQDVELSDIPNVVAMFANPGAAWQSQVEARAAKAKSDKELSDFTAKEEVKADIAARGDDQKMRTEAIKSIRERMTDLEGGSGFDNLAEAEQEKLIQQELGLQTGSAAKAVVPTPNVIVDGRTGKGLGMEPQPSAAAGLGTVPQSRPMATTGSPSGDAGLAMPTEDQIVSQASQMLLKGDRPEDVAKMLQTTGVNAARWPAEAQPFAVQ